MSLPLILQPGEGRSVQIRTSKCTFKVTGNDTHGHFGLFEFVMEPQTDGASPHIHKQLTEIFYVVEGNVELVVGSRAHICCSWRTHAGSRKYSSWFLQSRLDAIKTVDYVLSC